MPFAPEPINPKDRAQRARAVSQTHGVVRATSRVLHGQPLADSDQEALRWAGSMLSRILQPEPIPNFVGHGNELMGVATSEAAFREAFGKNEAHLKEDLGRLRDAVELALREPSSEAVAKPMAELRQLFVLIGRTQLSTAIADNRKPSTAGKLWLLSTPSLSS